MCDKCGILHLHDGFRSPLQYFHEIDKIRSLVDEGVMSVDFGTVPLFEITGNSRGYLRHELSCSCGARFAVWFDSDSNSGGLCIIE